MKKSQLAKNIMAAILIVPIYKLSSFEYLFPVLNNILDIMKVLGCITLILLFVSQKFKIDIFMVSLIGIEIVHGISTILNQSGSIWNWCIGTGTIISVYLYMRVFIVNGNINLKFVLFIPKLFIYMNILCFFIWPNGMYTSYDGTGRWYSDQNWILGGKNTYFPFFLSIFLLNIIEIVNKEGRIKLSSSEIVFCFACLFNIFIISQSATGIIGLILILIFFFIQRTWIMKSNKMIFVYIVITIIVTYILLFNRSYINIINIIPEFMSKTRTFNTRILIWERSLIAISKELILGYGLEISSATVYKIGQTTTHNKYLQSLYQGGLIGSFFTIIMLSSIFRDFYKNYKIQIVQFLSWMLFVFLMIFEVESLDKSRDIMILLTICFYWRDIFSAIDFENKPIFRRR